MTLISFIKLVIFGQTLKLPFNYNILSLEMIVFPYKSVKSNVANKSSKVSARRI